MSHYLANVAIVRERWPQIAQSIEAATLRHEVVVVRGPGDVTLQVDGLHLTSAYNRVAEAAAQAERIPAEASAAAVYGIGLGDLPRALLARPNLERLRVVLLSPAITRQSLDIVDQRDWLSDARVTLVGDDRSPQPPFAVVPAELRLAGDAVLPLRDALLLALAQPYADAYWQKRQRLLEEHIAANAGRMRADGDVASLFATRRGGRVGVVASGPSLNQRLAWLQAHRQELSLVAVSSAVPPLLAAGVIPDVVIMIDAVARMPLSGSDLEKFHEVPLVYAPEVTPETVAAWPGPRLVTYLPQPRYVRCAAATPKGCLWTSGTVTHSAVDLARQMGAAEIVLFGVDFAYPGAQSHAVNATQHANKDARRHRFSVLNGDGERVMSDPNLIAYLRDLEGYVAAYPSVRFVNAGREGAAIRGVSHV